MELYWKVLPWLAMLYPAEMSPSDELRDALWFIDAPCEGETVIQAGFGAGIVAFFLPAVGLVFGLPVLMVPFLMILVAIGTIHVMHSLPHQLAAFKRIEALGDAPNLVGRIVLRMKIQPAMESAVRFGVETGRGPLVRSLSGHIDRAVGTPESGLIDFAEDWGEHFPALRRSGHLLSTAPDAAEAKRERTLERALTAMLDGTRDQMAEFTNRIRGPVTGLYAFGVMLPLALVSLAPAVSMAGIPLTIEVFVVFYDIILPVVIISAGVWLLSQRPVAFPPPEVTRDHPDVETHSAVPVVLALASSVVGSALTRVIGLGYLIPISAVGLFIGAYLYVYYKPIEEVRQYVRAVEEHLIDALYIVGRQVDDREAVESAIETAGERVPAETGDLFEHAARLQHQLHLTVDQAFLGRYGALRDIPSPRAHATASLLSIAAHEGQPAGSTVVSMADHLEELREVEKHTKREISNVTNTLQNTAKFFGPLVAGATVGLSNVMMSQNIDFSQFGANVEPLNTELLAIVVGIYIIMLCLLLEPLSIGLKYGLDRAQIGYKVGVSLLIAVPTYVATVAVVGAAV